MVKLVCKVTNCIYHKNNGCISLKVVISEFKSKYLENNLAFPRCQCFHRKDTNIQSDLDNFL